MNISEIAKGYLAAAEFTDCGPDAEDAMRDASWSQQATLHAADAAADIIAAFGLELLNATAASGAQIGHDLWLTRNGHGSGFWDKEDLYGPITSEHLDAYATTCGEVYVYAGDDGLLYID